MTCQCQEPMEQLFKCNTFSIHRCPKCGEMKRVEGGIRRSLEDRLVRNATRQVARILRTL